MVAGLVLWFVSGVWLAMCAGSAWLCFWIRFDDLLTRSQSDLCDVLDLAWWCYVSGPWHPTSNGGDLSEVSHTPRGGKL